LTKLTNLMALKGVSVTLQIQHFTGDTGLNEIKINFGPGLRVYYGVIDDEITSYDEKLAAKLQDQEFAKDFILDLIEGDEGLIPMEALRHTIRRMGIKEFSEAAKTPYESVYRMLESDSIQSKNHSRRRSMNGSSHFIGDSSRPH